MTLPLSPIRARILVPIGSAHDVQKAIAVHVHRGDSFGVIVAETMDKKRAFSWASVHAGAGPLHASFMLSQAADSEQRRGNKERKTHAAVLLKLLRERMEGDGAPGGSRCSGGVENLH